MDGCVSFTSIFILFQVHGNTQHYLMVFLTYVDDLILYHSVTPVFPLMSCFMVLSQPCFHIHKAAAHNTPAIQSPTTGLQHILLTFPRQQILRLQFCPESTDASRNLIFIYFCSTCKFSLRPSNLPDLVSFLSQLL